MKFMRGAFRRKNLLSVKSALCAIISLIGLGTSTSATADPITYTFTTNISFVQGSALPLMSVGDNAYITVTYDPNAPLVLRRTNNLVRYRLDQLDIHIGNYSESYSFVKDIMIYNDFIQGGQTIDGIRLEGASANTSLFLDISDFSHSVYSNLALPTGIPDLSAFDLGSARPPPFANYDLSFRIQNNCCLTGQAWGTTLSVTAPVPEPETYAMMLAGLGILGFMARRRKDLANY